MAMAPITAACFGVAGPVVHQTAALTNVPWRIEAQAVVSSFGIPKVQLLNDLEAMARAVPVLRSEELHTLQHGEAQAGGNMAVIAAGTGLGEAVLHRVGDRFVAMASEAGHADFAARTDAEITLLKDLTRRFGRAQIEHVVSGQGLMNIHRITHDEACSTVPDLDAFEAPSRITAAALDNLCHGCIAALEIFVDAYGAEAGNLALRSLATAGIFVGGGIAPKILPLLTSGRFVHAFVSKAPFEALLRRIPIHVILDPQAGLLGAAVAAADGY
jgi:glucokinase